ncbi:MAG: pyridoxamine 5'-phosphate oxidase family protein [Alphaproteobacteria bacterium]
MSDDQASQPPVPPRSDRVRLRRMHERGRYDFEALCAVLDAGCLCHVGYVLDGAPVVTPTLYWREGRQVYWHGSGASRMLETSAGTPVCLSVAHFDGFVMARSAFNHSINYRSAMLFGTAEHVSDPAAKVASLRYFVETLFPGRWDTLRAMTGQEAKATMVLRMPIDEASAKVRSGPPRDVEDAAHPVWAGVLPVRMVLDAPVTAPGVPAGIEVPAHVRDFDIARPQRSPDGY